MNNINIGRLLNMKPSGFLYGNNSENNSFSGFNSLLGGADTSDASESVKNLSLKAKTTLVQTILGHTSDDFSENYSNIFKTSLMSANAGLLLALLLITIIYQIKYRNDTDVGTYFNANAQKNRWWKVIIDAMLTGVIGVISVMAVFGLRKLDLFDANATKTYMSVFSIMFLFNIAQESTGFNKFLEKSDIVKGNSLYGTIIGNNQSNFTPEEITEHKLRSEKLASLEKATDPFIISFTNLCIAVVVIGAIVFIAKMMYAASAGADFQKNSIGSIDYLFGGDLLSSLLGKNTLMFVLETVLVIGGFNFFAPIVGKLIRKESFTGSAMITPVAVFFIAIILQIMLQYVGAYIPEA